MVQGYFTLKEAAEATGLSEDELKQRAQRKEIRSFQDRGTLRFRIQEVQELQRQLMGGSDVDFQAPEVPAPEAPRSGKLGGPKSGPKTPTAPKSGKLPPASSEEVLDFELDESIDIGREPLDLQGSSARSKSRLSGAGPKSGGAPKTPKRLTSGSDSDVKLVADVSAPREPNASDSDVRLDDLGPSTGSSSKRMSSSGRLKSKHGPSPADSGVRLVPMGDEPPVGADDATLTDQPIAFADDPAHREPPASRASDNILQTEEIDLDAEQLRRDGSDRKPKSSKSMHPGPKTPRTPKPTASPFELSDDGTTQGSERKHTDFELPPPADDEDFSLELSDDSLDLGAEPGPTGAPASGINLSRPIDAGVSLESDDDEGSSDFELTLDDTPAHKTPKPSRAKQPTSSDDSDFELTLDYDEGATPKADEGSGEFELSLDDGSPAAAEEGSSEFELTLDDGGAAGAKEDSSGERDIFETDFELPSLEEGSEEATIDAGSSDFELALDDSDIATDDESGSQVIALDEGEYADDGEQTVTGEYGDVEEEYDEEGAPVREKVVVEEVIRDRWIKPAPWGILPTIFMLPCTVVMILIGIMTFEMVASGSGYHSSGVLTKAIAAQILPENAKTK